jgi:hypothetical protein
MKTRIRQENDGQARKLSFVIDTLEDYTLATHRVAALSDCSKDRAAAQELNALLKAVQAWDAEHDAATRSTA